MNAYFMILNEDGSYNPETYLIEVPDVFNYQELLHEFKEMNGWTKKWKHSSQVLKTFEESNHQTDPS